MLNMNQEFEESFFDQARRNMIDSQLKPNGVFKPAVIAAFETIPREVFVSKAQQDLAYGDQDIALQKERFMLNTMVFAKMLHASDLSLSDHVLDLGCGNGYTSFILSLLSAQVTGVEKYSGMVTKAQGILDKKTAGWEVNPDAIFFEHSALDGTKLQESRKFNVIMIEGLIDEIPQNLSDRLANHGRLMCFERDEFGRTFCMKYQKIGQSFSGAPIFSADVPVLFSAKKQGFEF